MKAKSKVAKRVVRLQKKLPNATIKQKKWFFENALNHIAYRNKGGTISCMDCGHRWKSSYKQGWHDETIGVTCPNCKHQLKVKTTQNRTYRENSYVSIITTKEEYQVIRLFIVYGWFKIGQERRLTLRELTNTFINDKGRTYVIGHWRSGGFYDNWCGDWSLRKAHTANNNDINAFVYPIMKIIPEIKRNGFKSSFHNMKTYTLFNLLLTNSKIETLWKAKMYSFVKRLHGHYLDDRQLNKHWNLIKIAMRHNYKIKDPGLWYDYIDFLLYFNKDVHNPMYLCPKNLKVEHNRYLTMKREIAEELRNQDLKAKRLKEERAYRKKRRAFKGFKLEQEDILIEPFKSVKDLREQSILLDHCAYESNYHKKVNSLLLSAKLNGIPIETIEVSLEKFKLIQVRGYDNHPSEYNSLIKKIVKQAMPKIKKAYNNKPVAQVAAQ